MSAKSPERISRAAGGGNTGGLFASADDRA